MNNQKACEILGVESNANEEVIKRNYKKLALRWHPDKNSGNSEKFKEINEAYQYLTKATSNTLDDLLGQLFRDMAFKPKGPTISVSIKLTLEELYLGGTHKIKYQRNEPTGTFKQMLVVNQMGPIVIHEIRMVPDFRSVEHEYDLVIEKFQQTDTPIVIDLNDYTLSIQIEQIPHPMYTRVGQDLYTTLTISLKEALVGFHRNIVVLSGNELDIICKSVVNPSTIKYLDGEGMGGKLFVKFNIEFPKEISESDRNILLGCGF